MCRHDTNFAHVDLFNIKTIALWIPTNLNSWFLNCWVTFHFLMMGEGI
jgi:hypothetical protein